MLNPPAGFENPDNLARTYPYFDLSTRRFSGGWNGKQFVSGHPANENLYFGGIPLLYKEQRLYIDSSDTHTIVYGATGSLKTRTIVSPFINLLGNAGESMIINDPKGELYARHADVLRKKWDYHVIEINFRNPSVGNSWNPLAIPYQFYLSEDYDRATEFVNDIANNLMLAEHSTDDPFWDYSASDLVYGLILLLFRYCKDFHKSSRVVNIGNLLQLKRTLFSKNSLSLQNSPLWKYASEDELVTASLSGSIYAPSDTRNSILSVFDQKLRTFTIQPTLLDMLANNDFDLADVGKYKTAIFLITPDEKTSYHRLVSMFIKESYEYLIYLASQTSDGTVGRRINYVLDEFSSLPAITDFPAMISAARSRAIKFLLVVQSRSSLKKRYREEAETIISNCNNWVFFTSRELELLRELSELCGMQRNHMPNISVYDLQHLNKDRQEALIMAGRFKPMMVHLLDIDRFGNRCDRLPEHNKPSRFERLKVDFTIPVFQADSNHSFETLSEIKSPVSQDTPIDIDELVRNIDEQIAQLEAEQAAEDAKRKIPSDETKPANSQW